MTSIHLDPTGIWPNVLAAYSSGLPMVDYSPRVLCIEPTNACNFACTSCVRPHGKPDMLDVADLVEWVDREPEPFRNAPVWVHFSGESLLHPRLAEILAVLRERDIQTMLSTNASRLNGKQSDMLIDSGLKLLVFSLDAARRETYERIRVGGDFAEVERNVREFLERRGTARRSPVTQAQLVLGDQTMEEIFEFVDRWVESGVDAIHLKRYSTRGGMLAVPTRRAASTAATSAGPCLDPWLNVIVRADGRVVPCCSDFTGRLVLGSLHESTLAEIWNGEKAVALRTAHATGEGLPDICKACSDIRGPQERDEVLRFAGAPGSVEELAAILTEWPRHLLFNLTEGD